MQLRVEDFVALSTVKMRMFSGPSVIADETCLITMEDLRRVPHVAHASDGRAYDAFALQKWLSSTRSNCAIDTVTLYSFPVAFLSRASSIAYRTAKLTASRASFCALYAYTFISLFPDARRRFISPPLNDPPPKTTATNRQEKKAMLLRVIDCNRRCSSRHTSARCTRLKRSATSAFETPVNKRARLA